MKLTKSVRRWAALSVALVLLLTLVMLPTPVLANPDVAITAVGAYSAHPFTYGPFDNVDEGASFWVKINVGGEGDTVTNFDAADYVITYDPVVLSVAMTQSGSYYYVTAGNIADGDIGSSGPTGTPNVAVVQTREIGAHDSGVIKVVNNVAGYSGLSGYGYLCALKFTVIGLNTTSSSITPSQVTLGDKDANLIPSATPTAETITVDELKVTAISVVGETDWGSVVTNKGYVTPGYHATTYALTVSVEGGCGAYTNNAYNWSSSGGTFGADPDDDATNTVTYGTSGTKADITVTVTDDLGSDTTGDEVSGTAIVYDTFTFSFTEDRTQGIKNDTRPAKDNTIQFNSTAAHGNESYTYLWAFDGGSGTTTDADPDVTFTPSGTKTGHTYNVSVTGKDTLIAQVNADSQAIHIYQKGDVNMDNTVNALDITKSELIVGNVGTNVETFTSDVNMDNAAEDTSADTTATEVAVAEAWDIS